MKKRIACTFCTEKTKKQTLEKISNNNVKDVILYTTDNHNELMLAYIIEKQKIQIPKTIIVHKKSKTNTFYTINAMNQIIMNINNGILDKKFKLDWNLYSNMILIYKERKVSRINIYLKEKLKLN